MIWRSRADSKTSALRFQGPKKYPAKFERFRLVRTLVYRRHPRQLPGTAHFRLKRDEQLSQNQPVVWESSCVSWAAVLRKMVGWAWWVLSAATTTMAKTGITHRRRRVRPSDHPWVQPRCRWALGYLAFDFANQICRGYDASAEFLSRRI